MSAIIESAAPAVYPESPASYPDSPVSRVLAQPMMLGLFLPIQAGGWSASHLERSTTWTFDYNLALVRRAEDFGFDLAFGPRAATAACSMARRSIPSPRWRR
jgi:FMNH2-dependent dimethyl sulfone monooxygenase